MEEISSQQHHVDILLFSKAHHLVETLPTVIATFGVSFGIAHMVICGYKDAYGIRG